MDYAILPPEINSARMYTGPGAGSMLAAAESWDALSAELGITASSYESALSGLTTLQWRGAASESMMAVVKPYVGWLSTTAEQAQQSAMQARAAALAYEQAYAMTVAPPAIAANRMQLTTLIATNFFGQNTAAIAATEAQYAEMWAQDAVAMYVYAGSSASASALTPFTSPDQNTNPGSSAAQAAAVSKAAGTAAGNVQSAVSGATTSAASTPLDTLSNLISVFLSAPTDLATLYLIIPMDALSGPVDLPIAYLGTISGARTDDTISGWEGVVGWPGTGVTPPEKFPAIITNPGPIAASAQTTSAGLGQADTIGALSVPSNWTVAAPEIRSVAMTSPITNASAAAAAPVEAGSANTFNQMGLAGMAGQGMAGPPAGGDTRQGAKPVTHARLPGRAAVAAADDDAEVSPAPRTVVTGVAAAIRDIARQRDEGRLSEQEYTEQKKRLLEISIRHRPLG
jgi:PPE-repeat protein